MALRTRTRTRTSKFSVLQYNTLACDKADNSEHGFPYVDASILDWETRGPRLIERILEDHNYPDFICLQEVDRPDFFDKHFKEKGYDGVFIPKLNSIEGIAIYWKRERFTLRLREKISFGKIYNDDQSQVACFLHMSDTSNYKIKFIIGTTHLKAKENPLCSHIRLMQCKILSQYLTSYIRKDRPIIMTGDFNDVFDSHPMQHFRKTGMNMAYRNVDTTCKKRGPELTQRMIDYIFFSGKYLTMDKSEKLISEFPENGLPSKDEPSDHLPLMAHFTICRG